MTLAELMRWAEQQGLHPLLFRNLPEEGMDEELEEGFETEIFDVLSAKTLGSQYPNAIFLGLRGPEYETATAVWMIGQCGDETCRIVRVLCGEFPTTPQNGFRAIEAGSWDTTFAEAREIVEHRLQRGYVPVELPTGIPLILGIALG